MALKQWGKLSAFLMITIVIGCNPSNTSVQVPRPLQTGEHTQITTTDQKEYSSESWDSLMAKLKSVSVITKEGYEIVFEPDDFTKHFQQDPFLHPVQATEEHYNYTVLLRSHTDQPAALLISNQGIKWGNLFYNNETSKELGRYIREKVASHFFTQLKSDNAILTSADMDRSTSMHSSHLNTILEELKQSEFIQGQPRLPYPLFPYYILDLYIGGKELVQIHVLSPTLISLMVGGEMTYYQTTSSLYSPLKQMMGTTNYPISHVNYLYRATEIEIFDHVIPFEKKHVMMNKEQLNTFEVRSIIHHVVRELAKGDPLKEQRKVNQLPLLTIEFIVDQARLPVKIYGDYFTYGEQAFAKPQILNQLRTILEKDKIFKTKEEIIK